MVNRLYVGQVLGLEVFSELGNVNIEGLRENPVSLMSYEGPPER